jgi:hypothetical protein
MMIEDESKKNRRVPAKHPARRRRRARLPERLSFTRDHARPLALTLMFDFF